MKNTLLLKLSFLVFTLAAAVLMTGCDREHHRGDWRDHNGEMRHDHDQKISVGDKGHSDDTDMSISVKSPD